MSSGIVILTMATLTPIVVPSDIKTIDKIVLCDNGDVSNCTHPAGHCFGSDGGSGIPDNLKVAPGRGGEQEVWTLSTDKTKVDKKEIYNRCQYCQKLHYAKDKEDQ